MPQRTDRVNFRAAPDEVRMLHELAERDGVSASDWIRLRVRSAYAETFGTKKPRMPRRTATKASES